RVLPERELLVVTVADDDDARLDVADRSRVDRRSLEVPIDRAIENAIATDYAVRREDAQAGIVGGAEVGEHVADRCISRRPGTTLGKVGERGLVAVMPVGDVHAALGESVPEFSDGETIADGPNAVLVATHRRLGGRLGAFDVAR